MTSRTASVATTLTMLNCTASRVAMVDFPTPVAPPIITTRGTSRVRTSSHRRKFLAYRSPSRSVRTSWVSAFRSSLVIMLTRRASSRSSISSAI
jgi:hypothetical protein